MTRRTLFSTLVVPLTGLLPWRWFRSKRPRFTLTIEPIGLVTLTTVNDRFQHYLAEFSLNGQRGHVTIKQDYRYITIESQKDILPELSRWMEANPDVWVSRYTKPPKETLTP